MRAVDLGAAPGGWTWQLAQRGVAVTAVDNGPLKGARARRPRSCTHVREDAFRLAAAASGRLARVRRRASSRSASPSWSRAGSPTVLARRAIFNLKLPMKKRYDEVRRCVQRIARSRRVRGVRITLACGSSTTTARK